MSWMTWERISGVITQLDKLHEVPVVEHVDVEVMSVAVAHLPTLSTKLVGVGPDVFRRLPVEVPGTRLVGRRVKVHAVILVVGNMDKGNTVLELSHYTSHVG